MDYINPYGASGTGRPAYVNGNPAAGIQGSIPDVRCWEYPMREIIAVIEGAGITPSNGDLGQLLEAIHALTTTNTPSVGSLWHIGTPSGGASSAFTTNLAPSVPAGATGFFFTMPVSATSTQASGHTTVDYGNGPKVIVLNSTGENAPAGCMRGDANYVAVFYFDGTNARLLNPYLANESIHEGSATTGSSTAMVTALMQPPPAAAAGLKMRVPITTTNGVNPTLDFGFGPKPLVLNSTGTALSGGEMPGSVGYEADIEYDGVSARLLNPSLTSALQNLVVITDQKTNGTPGGLFTAGAWRTRDLNTVVADPQGLTSGGSPRISLAGNNVTLQPGVYLIEASAPALSVETHKVRFQNTTDGTTAIWGASENTTGNVSSTPDQVSTRSYLVGIVTVTAAKVFQLQHICSTTSSGTGSAAGGVFGFGCPSTYGLGASDGPETYSILKITKVG